MANMTYRDLLTHLQSLDEHELDMNVSVLVADINEFVPVSVFWFAGEETDVLDEGHPYIITKG
jgi:hypothetical protein